MKVQSSLLGVIVVSARIKPLSLQLANQIAAGEVVERPASVVKELLENSIDAHCHQLHIEIERGGSTLIRIVDDGQGIDKEDLALAVTRHATSKLQTLSELEKITSLGFRGEALASVSAVSKLSIKSQQAEHEQAWMINTGTESDFANYTAEPEPVAHAQGTTVEVRDLFFNTPARRKFMRTVKTEFRHIDDIVKRIALSQYDIAFKLTHNKKLLRHLPKALTEKAITQRIGKLFSPEFLSHAYKVDLSSDHFSNMGTLRLWGWVSSPQWQRKQSDWQYFYVNGRYIKDKLVNHALRQAYQELLPEDTFSAYLLYLEIDPKQVDVNVHPTKHEVRFRESRLIHDFIYSALKQALFPDNKHLFSKPMGSEPLSHQTAIQSEGENVRHYSHENQQPFKKNYQPQIQSSLNENQIAEQLTGLQQLYGVQNPAKEVNSTQNELARKTKQSFFGTSLGCLVPNYLMSQTFPEKSLAVEDSISVEDSSEGMPQIFIIHIKRAQQFLLMKLFHAHQPVPLLIPETVSLMNSDIISILKHQDRLMQWGVELSQLGDDSLMIRGMPSLQGIPGCTIDIKSLIKSLSSLINKNEDIDDSKFIELLVDSVRSETLRLAEQATLLKMLSEWVYQSGSLKAFVKHKAVWKVFDESKLERLF